MTDEPNKPPSPHHSDHPLRDGDESRRRSVIRSLSTASAGDALPALMQALYDERRAVQESVIATLENFPPKSVTMALLPLLEEQRADVRNIAIEGLILYGKDAVDVLIDALGKPHRDVDVNMFLLDILGEIGDPAAVRSVIPWMTHSHPNIRNSAIMASGKMGSPSTIEHLRAALRDEDWICFSAIEAIATIGGIQAEQALLEMLRNNRGDMFDIACLEGLAKSRNMEIVQVLLDIMLKRPKTLQRKFLETICRILDGRTFALSGGLSHETRKTLHDLAEHASDSWSAYFAICTLELLQDDRSTECLIRIFSEESRQEMVRFAAARALGTIGDPTISERALLTIRETPTGSGTLGDIIEESLKMVRARKRETQK